MSDVSLVFNLIGRDKGASSTIARAAGQVRAANVASAASTVALGAAMASAAAWAVALGGAGVQAAAGVGLIPGAAFAAAAALATFKFGTFGLGDAWKATGAQVTGGGQSAYDTAKKVAAAQHEVRQATLGLQDAQRAALKAQQDLTRAREDEALRIADLSRNLAGAKLDEEGAVMAVADAEKALADARRSGTKSDTDHALLALKQSQQTLEDVRARVSDLDREKTRADRNGVEGSDAVKSALDQQLQAQRGVEDATYRLAQAQQALADSTRSTGAANQAAADAMAALSPNARELILALRGLGGQWTALRKDVQDSMWAGVAGDITALSGVYLPVLRRGLVGVGGAFNVAIRESMGLARTRGFVTDVDTTLANTSVTAGSLARAVAPIVNGLMQLAAVGSSFLPGMGRSVLAIAQDFERWMVSARQSGQLQQWLGAAVGVLTDVWHIGANVAHIVMDIFTAPGNAAAGGGLLKSLEDGTAKLHAFLSSAEGQNKIASALETLRNIVGNVAAALPALVQQGGAVSDTFSVTGTVMGFLADHTGLLAAALPYLAAGYLLVKTAEVGGNIARIASLPIMAAQVAANWGLRGAMAAHTAALAANTAATRGAAVATGTNTTATVAGDVAAKRGVISMIASKVAMVAMGAASKVAAVGQWLLNAALYANPIGLIVLGVLLLVAGIILLWQHSETFRTIVTGAFQAVWGAVKFVWDWVSNNWPLLLAILTGPIGLAVLWITRHWDEIKAGASAVKDWIVGKFEAFAGFVSSLPGRLAAAGSGLFHWVIDSYKSAINWVIGRWNSLSFRLPPVSVPGLGQVWGGMTLNTPDIPFLAKGGTVTSSGMAVVGEAGPELVSLNRGASVVPLNRGGGGRVVVDLKGADGELKRLFRRMIRVDDLLEA